MRNVISTRVLLGIFFIGNIASGAYIVALKLDKSKAKTDRLAAKNQLKLDLNAELENYRKHVVRQTLASKSEDIEMCFQDYLKNSPEKTQGAVKVSWAIDKSGTVSDVKLLSSDLQNEFLEKCISDHVSSTHFISPTFAEEVQVAHKFNFRGRSPASISFE